MSEGHNIQSSTETDVAQAESFEATVELEPFKQFLAAPNAICDEFVLHVDGEGFHTSAVDPANVAMVAAHLETTVFERLDGEAEFGINCRKLANLLDRELEDEQIRMEWNAESRVLNLSAGPYSYEFATINADSVRNEPEIPDLDLPCVVVMGAERLRTAVEYFDEFSTHVNVSFDAEGRRFTMDALERSGAGRGASIGTDQGSFELDAPDLVDYAPGDASSHFSLDYFSDITEAIPATEVSMDIGEEFPMKLRYDLGPDGRGKHGAVTFMQAPRIQSD